jgi:hypothetical protein
LGIGGSIAFKADLTEASIVGESTVRYKFTNPSNANETLSFTTKYNIPASLLSNNLTFESVSPIYPNPTNSKAFVTVNAINDVKDINLSVINALGSVVNTKHIELNKGKNVVQLDFEELNSGIYLISISNKESVITRKLTVTK